MNVFTHQSRWKPSSTLFLPKIWEISCVCLYIYLFLQLIFFECPLIFTLSSSSGKGNGHRKETVKEKTGWLVWTQKVGLATREFTKHSNRILQGGPGASLSKQSNRCLDYMFRLPGFRGKSSSPTSRDTGAVLGQLAGCHHTSISLLHPLPCHPFPWEASSSHMSSARKVSVNTSVWIPGCSR